MQHTARVLVAKREDTARSERREGNSLGTGI